MEQKHIEEKYDFYSQKKNTWGLCRSVTCLESGGEVFNVSPGIIHMVCVPSRCMQSWSRSQPIIQWSWSRSATMPRVLRKSTSTSARTHFPGSWSSLTWIGSTFTSTRHNFKANPGTCRYLLRWLLNVTFGQEEDTNQRLIFTDTLKQVANYRIKLCSTIRNVKPHD